MRQRSELLICYGFLISVLLVASYFGPPSRDNVSGTSNVPSIEKIAERSSYVEAISSSSDGSVFLTFRDENEVFSLNRETGELAVVYTLLNPKFIVPDKRGGLHASYSADPGYGDVFDSAVAWLSHSGMVEEMRVRSKVGGLAIDGHGSVYLTASHAGEVWKVDVGGRKTMLLGSGIADETKQIIEPEGIAVNGRGQVLISNSRHTVLLLEGGQIKQLAGLDGECGMADGAGTAARFCGPSAVAADLEGNFLVVDQDCAVRKVTPSGEVTTLIGLLGREPKGIAQLPAEQCATYIRSVAVEGNGDILLAARSAFRIHLRR